MKVILSPHLDDAVLSCWHVLADGDDVSVVNVFTGSPDEAGDYWWDRLTGSTDSVARMRERVEEDREALSRAGRVATNLGLLDNQYRRNGSPGPDVMGRLGAQIASRSTVYAPAAFGDHLDHVLVRDAAVALAREGCDVHLYADLPHAIELGWPSWVTGEDGGDLDLDARWRHHFEQAGLELGPPSVRALDADAWLAKQEALGAYRTQLGALERMAPLERLRWEVTWPLQAVASREQTRACYPGESGFVERDGHRVFYEVYGDGEPTLLLLPTWTIIHSRFWKMQIPYLARHFRVVTFDGLGNGRSDRPTDVAAYGYREFAKDALAVMDATETEKAVTVSLSRGAQWNLELAGTHGERVLGAVFHGPMYFVTARSAGFRLLRGLRLFDKLPESRRIRFVSWFDDRAGKFNFHYIKRDFPGFIRWWMSLVTTEPHSTKAYDDAVEWGLESDPETLIRTILGEAIMKPRDLRAAARRIECPVLVICGTEDKITPHRDAKVLAKTAGGELVSVKGGDHFVLGRRPVEVNLAIRQFVESLDKGGRPRAMGERRPGPSSDPTAHRSDGRKRALFISSPIGLGHAQRDVAIARELRQLVDGLEVDWLAQDPVTRVLEGEGERIHPASRHLANESRHMESESAEHDLHCFQAFRRMDEILCANFMLFHDVVRDERYDLWIGDEAWELDYYLHENPREKRARYVWLTDFVGFLPMPDGGEREAFVSADYNAQMVEHVEGLPELRDRSIFVGNPEDIVDERLGPDLPMIRDWTERIYDFAGYVSGFDPAQFGDREALRSELGYGPGERVCVVTVGGSGVGAHLLRKVIASFPLAKQRVPELRMVVVAGPRIDPESLPKADGLEVRAYVHNLYRHLAACDLAVVQGGLTTAMELTANRRPFLYFPLAHHFEQNFHVHKRLERYRAGRRMDFAASTPGTIADAIASEVGREVDYLDVETDGARLAAERIAELL
jgi:pimeloyl-ACP methyl ester carboxylesterase/predicted glycosyltransferase/LmbE family N-acetylglucosaminyl deacetylase